MKKKLIVLALLFSSTSLFAFSYVCPAASEFKAVGDQNFEYVYSNNVVLSTGVKPAGNFDSAGFLTVTDPSAKPYFGITCGYSADVGAMTSYSSQTQNCQAAAPANWHSMPIPDQPGLMGHVCKSSNPENCVIICS